MSSDWKVLNVFRLVFLITYISGIQATSYLGCYLDKPDVLERALPYSQLIDVKMTVDICISHCSSLGFQYSGVEFKQECYCSKHMPRWDKLDDGKCDMACVGGDGKCGGADALSVWANKDATHPPDPHNRPLVCLVMILKDEAHTIMNTLQSVKDYVDCWYILDTGSSDGTQKIILDYMKDKPGKLFEEPFIDYGATRNRILVLAKQHGNPIFTLMLSADEKVKNPNDMRAFLEEFRYANGTMHGAYPVVMNTGMKFDSIRLARVDSKWRYKARVHEYLAPSEGPFVALYRPKNDIEVLFNVTDGPRRYKSQFYIQRILEEDLFKDPNDTRSIYYLARTTSGVGNHTASLYYYQLLAQRSKWDEEVYHGMTMRAIEAKLLDIPWLTRQTWLLEAYAYKPTSMDAIYTLAQDHFDSGRFALAYLFAQRAVQIKKPVNLQVVENVLLRPTSYLYEYEAYRLLGFAAREMSEWYVCIDAFKRVLTVNPGDDIVKNRIQTCQDKYREQGGNLNLIPNYDKKSAAAGMTVGCSMNKELSVVSSNDIPSSKCDPCPSCSPMNDVRRIKDNSNSDSDRSHDSSLHGMLVGAGFLGAGIFICGYQRFIQFPKLKV